MVRRNIKLFSVLLVCLFLIGLTGFFMAFPKMNANYEIKVQTLEVMSRQILKLQYKLDINRHKINNYDFMAFKTSALSNRFPRFAHILDSVYEKSFEYGFKPDLVMAMIKVESGFNPAAVSYKGAYGLMQVNLAVWRSELNIDERRIFEVDYNIDLGLRVLKHYYDETGGNLKRALHLYNNGYLYNNTSYTEKVGSAVMSFSSSPVKLTIPSPGAVGY
jgi:soluble lytic murein transglycosylase-like protein